MKRYTNSELKTNRKTFTSTKIEILMDDIRQFCVTEVNSGKILNKITFSTPKKPNLKRWLKYLNQ